MTGGSLLERSASRKQRVEGAQPTDSWVVPLADVGKDDVPAVGGKCANLGELLSIGANVPPGFAVTVHAFRRFLEDADLVRGINERLRAVSDSNEPAALEAVSKEIRELIEHAPMPTTVADAIRNAYGALCRDAKRAHASVAVRSSATAEDLPNASFAGQQDTFLNVQGDQEVLRHVHRCWSSLYTPRAISYRKTQGFPPEKTFIAVAVQLLVPARSAGVLFTIDPVTGDRSHMIAEATWGLGESLVGGRVRPDRFVLDKTSLRVVERNIVAKTVAWAPSKDGALTVEEPVKPDLREVPALSDEELRRLGEAARRVESHYGLPQDIEFAVVGEGNDAEVYLLQARAETVWSTRPDPVQTESAAPVLKGFGASPGFRFGPARIIKTPEDAAKLLQPGDILVTHMTNPDWVPYMQRAAAIVTDDGGVTCHAAIVSREMGVPCIVGTREGTKKLREGQSYTIDGKSGLVYAGRVESLLRKAEAPAHVPAAAIPITSTRIYVNLSLPDLAERVARETHADGVGLLRAEHLLLSLGAHPRKLIEEGGGERMVEKFADGVRRVAAPFAPRPVVYRFLDFKPDEFLGLPGGEKYERQAGHVGPNPLIGYRGAFRYGKEPDIFRLECQAIQRVRREFKLTNVHVMVPFVRTVGELRQALRIMKEEGLVRAPDFKVWIMVEVPSTVLLIEDFLKEGVDGVSFGTNDLTMLILGIDRDDASVQEVYDERNPAVLRALGHVIRACREVGVTTSVCGQAPSNYPEVVEFLVREGATSLSVNPDKVIETKQLVASIERKLILDATRNAQANGNGGEGVFRPLWSR